MTVETCLLGVPCGRIVGTLTVLFLVSVLYAILLEWLEHRFGFVSDYTWLTVIAGVSYSLIALAVLDWRAGLLGFMVFCVSGLPIVTRSIVEDVQNRAALRRSLEERGE